MAAPVLVGVLVSLVVFAYSQHSLRSYPAFAAPGPNFHPLVPILVVLLVMGCLARRRHRQDRRNSEARALMIAKTSDRRRATGCPPTVSAPDGHGMILIEGCVDVENTTYRVVSGRSGSLKSSGP